jgi:hypothetical protein
MNYLYGGTVMLSFIWEQRQYRETLTIPYLYLQKSFEEAMESIENTKAVKEKE